MNLKRMQLSTIKLYSFDVLKFKAFKVFFIVPVYQLCCYLKTPIENIAGVPRLKLLLITVQKHLYNPVVYIITFTCDSDDKKT